jgi:hypothetical protein
MDQTRQEAQDSLWANLGTGMRALAQLCEQVAKTFGPLVRLISF